MLFFSLKHLYINFKFEICFKIFIDAINQAAIAM